MEKQPGFEKLAIRFGLLTTLGLITFFLVMKLVGLVHIVELRVLNVFILSYGIWMALDTNIKETGNNDVYLQSLALGVLTAIVAVIPFSIFIFIYLNWDVQFMQMVIANEWFGQYMNPYIVSFLIFFEGTISGFFIAFTLMQYMKKNVSGSIT